MDKNTFQYLTLTRSGDTLTVKTGGYFPLRGQPSDYSIIICYSTVKRGNRIKDSDKPRKSFKSHGIANLCNAASNDSSYSTSFDIKNPTNEIYKAARPGRWSGFKYKIRAELRKNSHKTGITSNAITVIM